MSIAAVVACAVAFIRRDRVGGIVLAASVVVASLLVLVVKNTVGRARPPIADMLGASPHSYSFPSGHTAMSTVLYGVLTVVLCRHVAHGVGRWLLAVNAALLVVGVGLSRVYLGFHWLTDVLAGWALGGAIVTVAIVVLNSRKLDRRGVR
ncbi:phosphatase PAP2 family protein [Branchiibius sp. NY16-3462-2]|uniref:phosphatase PAP2 family protein n=1 Tax=Branchiibius sp. NY16-3462-2 TaxID=1807500 RepID=UPI0025BEA0A3|nr:phosphatase PAP2 family protein [Branchiibius sp. NY16-3462-2]